MAKPQTQQASQERQSNVVPLLPGTTPVHAEVPQYFATKDLQKRYNVSNKQARNYAATVKAAYPWLEGELKSGNKYTQLMVEKIDEFKNSGLSVTQWVECIHAKNSEKLKPVQTEVVEQSEQKGGLLAKLDPSVLAAYQEPQEQESATVDLATYRPFTNQDYNQRYSATASNLAKQEQQELGFANTLLTEFSQMAQDNREWELSQQQQVETNLRDATLQGMFEGLREFRNKQEAKRQIMYQLETGQISPEKAEEMLLRLANQSVPKDQNG